MAFHQVNGIKLHSQSIGEGAPLVLVHGIVFCNMSLWYFTAAPLLSKHYRVLMYDLRGHGKSERVPTGYDVHTMVDDLAALLEAEGIDRLSLAGHSYGGLVALHFAMRFPQRVTKLALVDISLTVDLNELISELGEIDIPLQAALTEKKHQDDTPEAKKMISYLPKYLQDAFKRGRRQARNLVASLAYLRYETSLADDVCKAGDIADEELAKVTCPTLLLFGNVSSCLPVGQRLAKVLPKAELDIIAAGHLIPTENPQAMNKALMRFFEVS